MTLVVEPVRNIPEVEPGDDLAEILMQALTPHQPAEGDVIVVTQKVVSKAEGRLVRVEDPENDKLDVVLSESVRVLRRRGDVTISETRHGFVCANAGVDFSNIPDGYAALLPVDPDKSARRISTRLSRHFDTTIAVVISDTFGRPWRRGVTDVAIGSGGIRPIIDLRGSTDSLGRDLVATEVAIADEIAAAAEIVMGKSHGVPAAVVRGIDQSWFGEGSVQGEIVRDPDEDLFR